MHSQPQTRIPSAPPNAERNQTPLWLSPEWQWGLRQAVFSPGRCFPFSAHPVFGTVTHILTPFFDSFHRCNLLVFVTERRGVISTCKQQQAVSSCKMSTAPGKAPESQCAPKRARSSRPDHLWATDLLACVYERRGPGQGQRAMWPGGQCPTQETQESWLVPRVPSVPTLCFQPGRLVLSCLFRFPLSYTLLVDLSS